MAMEPEQQVSSSARGDSSGDADSPPFTPPSSPTHPRASNFTQGPSIPKRTRGASNSNSPFLIGVAGGTASGKTSVCKKIMEQLEKEDFGQKRVVMLSQDSFYKKLDSTQQKQAYRGEYNFDHPGMPGSVQTLVVCI